MNNMIEENEAIVYQVKLGNQVLTEAQSKPLAEHFITTLGADQQSEARIVPVTKNGQQVLLG